MKFIVKIIVVAVVIFLLPRVVPGISVADIYAALWVSLAFAAINILIKPLIMLVALPLNVMTLGLFGLVVNGALLYFVPTFISGFAIADFTSAFIGALIISAANWIISRI